MSRLFRVVISFVPWSIYSWIMHTSLTYRHKFIVWCLLLIFIMVANYQLILQAEAITLSNLFSFIFIFANHQFGWFPVLMRYPAGICYLILVAIAAASLLMKRPFTMRFAGHELSDEKRKHKIFYLINRNITVIWLAVFAINCLLNFYYSWSFSLRLISVSLLIFALMASNYLPEMMRDHYRKRYQSVASINTLQDKKGK